MCLQELRQGWLKWGGERPLAREWPGCWQHEQLMVLCHCVPVQWYSTYLLKSSLPATGLQASPAAPASCSPREAWPQHSSVPHYSPGSTSVAISVHSSLWFTVASLSALIHYPNILASSSLLVALVTWHRHWNLMVNPETLYGGVISWFWFPLHFCSIEAKNTSKKWVWQWAPTLNSLHSN